MTSVARTPKHLIYFGEKTNCFGRRDLSLSKKEVRTQDTAFKYENSNVLLRQIILAARRVEQLTTIPATSLDRMAEDPNYLFGLLGMIRKRSKLFAEALTDPNQMEPKYSLYGY